MDEVQQGTFTVVGRLVDLLGDMIFKIILYGSYARGDFDSESDIDIMMLFNG